MHEAMEQHKTTGATIIVRQPDGHESRQQLAPGNSLLVGSSADCGLQLENAEVAALHCLLHWDDRKLIIQDWCSLTGTIVDGRRIESECEIEKQARVEIGPFELCVSAPQFDASEDSKERNDSGGDHSQQGVAQDMSLDRLDQGQRNGTEAVSYRTAGDAVSGVPSADSPRDAAEPVPYGARESDPDHADESAVEPNTDDEPVPCGAESVPNSAESVLSSAFESVSYSADSYDVPAAEDDAVSQETIELLSAEVEHLQTELQERDLQLEELAQSISVGENNGLANDGATAPDQPLERLEQLLDELERGDERGAALEGLLQAEEEARLAERDERDQLEAWVDEIEQRIGQREEGWEAEIATLKRQLDDATNERNHLEQRLHAATAAAPPEPNRDEPADESTIETSEVVADLRSQNSELREELEGARAEQRRLQEELEAQTDTDAESKRSEYIDEALREQRIELAQEKAEFARQRSDLLRQQEELQRRQKVRTSRACDIDDRISVFREHLREIHSEEKQEQPPEINNSLSNRLARLWKRLD